MKKVVKCTVFFLILLMLFFGIYRVLSWKDTTDSYLSSYEMLYNTGDNLIDAVFLGSSHTYCTIYPGVMWNEKGISAFNMSVSGQDRTSAYYALKEVLKRQSPRVVFVEMYSLLYDVPPQEWMVYRNVITQKLSMNNVNLVKDLIEEEKQGDYLLRFPIIHTRYRELTRYDFSTLPRNKYARGEWIGWHIEPRENSESRFVTETMKLSSANKKWLQDLKALSEKENFELVLYLAPFNVNDYQMSIINGAKEYAQKEGIPFYDFNLLADEAGLDFSHDMLDLDHTNGYGAAKISEYIAGFLSEEYGLSDHRGDTAYHCWDEDYEYYLHSRVEQELIDTINTVDYYEFAKTIDDTVIYLSLDGDYSNITDWLYMFDLTDEDLALGGKWIYENGVRTKLMDNTPGSLLNREYSVYDSVLIQYVPENAFANILVNGNSVSEVANGLNIVVYDTFENRVLGTKSIAN